MGALFRTFFSGIQVGVCERERDREHKGVEWLNDPSNAEQWHSDVTILSHTDTTMMLHHTAVDTATVTYILV